jgi:hypothetical protein
MTAVGVAVGVVVGVDVLVGVGVEVGILVAVGVEVGVLVGVGVEVGVLVAVGVLVDVGVAVRVGVGVIVGVAVQVGVGPPEAIWSTQKPQSVTEESLHNCTFTTRPGTSAVQMLLVVPEKRWRSTLLPSRMMT